MTVKKTPQSNNNSKMPKANVSIAAAASGPRPSSVAKYLQPRKLDGRIRISKAEYLGDISGSASFSNASYPVNPGLVTSFPWLSALAANFEKYEFISLGYKYITVSGSTTNGSIIFAFDYDAADSAPVSKQQALNYEGALPMGAWWPPMGENGREQTRMNLDQNVLRRSGPKFVRQGSLASNLDIKTYDVGNLNVVTQDMSGSSMVGELWAIYDVELMVPQVSPAPGSQFSAKIVGSGSVSKSAIFGTSAAITGSLSVTASGATLTFNVPAQYLITVYISGSTIGTGATVTGTATTTQVQSKFASNDAIEVFTCNVTAAGQTAILDYTTGNTSVSASTVRISPYLASLS